MNIIKILFLIYFLSLSLYASQKIKVFTLHSYSQEYEWTKSQHNAFVQTLQESENDFEFHSEHLDTKRILFTQEYQDEFVYYLNKKYSDVNIDYVYVTDDNALIFIYNNYEKLFKGTIKPIIFFSGVNDLKMKNTLPKDRFIGVYEVKEVKENIELIKQFSPQTKDIYFLGDNSQTYTSIEKVIKNEEKNFQTLNFHYISDEYISGIIEKLPQSPRSFVILTTLGKLKDDAKNTLLVSESIQQMTQNNNIIFLTMEDAHMYENIVGGYVTSGSSQGKEAAKLLLKHFKAAATAKVSSLEKSPNLYIFNSKELVKSRIILSEYIARDAKIIGKDKNFVEKNQSFLLSTLSVLLIGLIFGTGLLFALLKKANNRLSRTPIKKEYENIKLKLSSKDEFINNIIALGNIGYWSLNTATDELFLSPSLSSILSIDNEIYKDDSAVLTYFTHEHDKALFTKSILDVKKSKKSLTFEHKMLSTNNELFNVTHTIYTQYAAHTPSEIIIGIIKFEK